MNIFEELQRGNWDVLKDKLMTLDSEFCFECDGCGRCCHKQDTILLTARDIYHIARSLHLTMEEVMKRYCWCRKGIRPSVPCHHIREYRYVYGAVEPLTGESSFLILPYCNTACMNVFLEHLSASYPDDMIVLVCDGAAWHKSGG